MTTSYRTNNCLAASMGRLELANGNLDHAIERLKEEAEGFNCSTRAHVEQTIAYSTAAQLLNHKARSRLALAFQSLSEGAGQDD